MGVAFPAPPDLAIIDLSPPCWKVKWPETPGFNPEDPGPMPEAASADCKIMNIMCVV